MLNKVSNRQIPFGARYGVAVVALRLAACALALGLILAYVLPAVLFDLQEACGLVRTAQAADVSLAADVNAAIHSDDVMVIPNMVDIVSAAEDSDAVAFEAVGDEFVDNGMTFEVTLAASEGQAGEVRLNSLDASVASRVDIPSAVVSTSGAAYTVTGLWFQAFTNNTGITQVSIPASVSSYRFNINRWSGSVPAAFVGCSSLTRVDVEEGCSCLISIDGVLYAKGASGDAVALLAFPQAKSDIDVLEVPASVHTVAPYACAGNTVLQGVVFASGLEGDASAWTSTAPEAASFIGGIGASAFAGCTALRQVTFPSEAKIATVSTALASAIGSYAFKGCTALETIQVPALMSADRKGDAYFTFEELNPQSTYLVSADSEFVSGYASYWHNSYGPVARPGFGSQVFEGCTSLVSVVFLSGNANGMYAYWTKSASVFKDCTSLETVVYEGAQPYWGDPNGSMQNSVYTDIWATDNEIAAPTCYYTVDYYLTAQDAATDGITGDARIARMAFSAGTSTADIAAGTVDLAGSVADSSLYAQTDSDGVLPDANEIAHDAGLGDGTWVWRLSGTQSHRAGLSDSCRAYLVRAADLSAGRIDATQVTALYRQTDRNLSRGLVDATAFDPARYYATSGIYQLEGFEGEDDVWFIYNAETDQLDGGFTVRLADGTALDASQYALSYQVYDAETGQLVDAQLGSVAGPYLITVVPAQGSSLTGVLQEWILVKPHEGVVSESYGSSVSDTVYAAKHAYQTDTAVSVIDFSNTPYAVTIGSADAVGALVASGYAGLVQGAVNVASSNDEGYGFILDLSTYDDGSVRDASKSISYARTVVSETVTAPSVYAVACYKAFARGRSSYGVTEEQYPWGSTAVLVPAAHAAEAMSIASWAYANAAPVLFTDEDGTVSDATLAILQQFTSVKVVGSTTWFSDEALKALEEALEAPTEVSRLGSEASTTGELSLAIAQDLVSTGKASYRCVSVVDGMRPADAVCALDFSGHEGGVTLVVKSTADAVAVAELLHANSFDVDRIMLFGDSDGNACMLESSAWTGSVFGAIWTDDATFAKVIEGVTSLVDEYANSDDNSDGDDSDSDSNGSSTSDDAGSSSSDNSSDSSTDATSQVTAPSFTRYGSTATTSGTSVTSYTATGLFGILITSASAADEGRADDAETQSQATTLDASTEDATEGSTLEQDVESLSSQSESTPLSQRISFLALLAALCAASVPTLRRCR